MSCAAIYDTIVCFGDSLTSFGLTDSGFVSRLQSRYDRRLEVLCRGFSGYTTREACKIAPRLFLPNPSNNGRIVLTIVWFGANDAALEGHRQHNPLENYLSELDSIISTIQDSIAKSSNPTSMEKSSLHTTQARILLLTPPAVHDNESLSGARDSNVTRKYAQALMEKDFGSEQIVKVDINSLFEEKAKEMQGGLKTLLREDGLHISQKGYDVVYEALVESISSNFPELDPVSLPMIIPRWSHLDRETSSEELERQLRTPSFDDPKL